MEDFLQEKFLNKKIVSIPIDEIITIENEAADKFGFGFELMLKKNEIIYKSNLVEYETYIVSGTQKKTIFTLVEKS